MRAVLIGQVRKNPVYYDLDGKETDAFVVDKENNVVPVNVISLIGKGLIEPINDSDFTDFFWNGSKESSKRWENIFIHRVQDVPDKLLRGVQMLTTPPKKKNPARSKAVEEKALRADAYKALVESEQHEKALGRSLNRFGGRATAGVRGFVRNARWDPDALDADGDGWVQEGTQFARRITGANVTKPNKPSPPEVNVEHYRALRSQQRRNYQNYLSGSISERLAKRKARFYIDRMEKVDQMIESRFSDGKRIKTVGDMRKAFERAHPGFITGDSTAEYLNSADPDEELKDTVREHGYMFLLALMSNPDLTKANWKFTKVDPSEEFSGAAAFKGPNKIDRLGKARDLPRNRKMLIEISYKDEFPEAKFRDAQQMDARLRLQLENTKIIASILRSDLPDDEKQEFVRRFHARSTAFHEMTHGSMYFKAFTDSLASVGLQPDEKTDADAILDEVYTAISDLAPEKASLLADQFWAETIAMPVALVNRVLNYLMLRSSMDPRAKSTMLDAINADLTDGQPNAPEPLRVSKKLSAFLNDKQIPKNLAKPNDPQDTNFEEGDALSINSTMNILAHLVNDLGSGNGYQNRLPWAGRKAVNFGKSEDDIALNWPLLLEHGIPNTDLDSEDVKTLLMANIRIGEVISEVLQSGNPDSIRNFAAIAASNQTQIAPAVWLGLTGNIANQSMREAYVQSSIRGGVSQLWESVKASGTDRDRGRIIDTLALLLGVWDDLTPQQRDLAKNYAAMSGGGLYASYAGYITNFTQLGRVFDGLNYELLAELGPLALFGNVAEMADEQAGGIRELDPSEPTYEALQKLISWLWPELPFALNGKEKAKS